MKKHNRIIKKNRKRLNKFYLKNNKKILEIIIDTLKTNEYLRFSINVSLYNGNINDTFIRNKYESNNKLLGFIEGLNIYIFVDRIIESTIIFKSKNMRKKYSLYKAFIYALSFVIYHEFYHIKEYTELSKDEFLELLDSKKEIGDNRYKKDREKYANKNSRKFVNNHINYIYDRLKI